MQYNLIKAENNFILVEVKENYKITPDIWYVKKYPREVRKSTSGGLGTWELIIASLNPIDKLPTLAFTDEVAKEIGYVDIEKMAWDFMMNTHPSDKRDNEYALFKNIYTQALNDNKDRVYTKEQMFGILDVCKNLQTVIPNVMEVHGRRYIESLHPTSWIVEIEMREFDDLDMITNVRLFKPKVTNNTITITKIIS